MREVIKFPNMSSMAQAAAALIEKTAAIAIDERDEFHLVLAGGRTPRAAYGLLAEPPYKQGIAWEKVHLWWGDERCVPPQHEDSNYRMAYEILIQHIAIPTQNIHRIKTELTHQEAAEFYEQEIASYFSATTPAWFDLILLGMGEDGHTASLFPGTKALTENVRRVVDNYIEQLNSWRITLTLPAINAARQIAVLVSGKNKVEILGDFFSAESQSTRKTLPIDLIGRIDTPVTWLVDIQDMTSF